MTTENATNLSRRPPGWLPWLLGGGVFAVLLLTLHPGLNASNIFLVSNLSGWNWRPNLYLPVTTIVTAPMYWLPTSWIPLAMNVFAAVCGALSIALLARCVTLLPHDRTHDQRERELSPHKLLTIRHAWLPPVFAVLTFALGLTFWQGATRGAAGMVDLLLFAYCVRCLLEFRVEQRESWLVRFALVYGLAMANSWTMILFFPAFLAAVVWVKGLRFFNLGFLVRTAVVGLAGLSLFLLLPAIMHFTHPTHVGFWLAVRSLAGAYKASVGSLSRGMIAGLCLTSVLPVTLIAIRWTSFFGDTSKLGVFLATSMFHLIHGFLLVFCLWAALDAELSPRGLLPKIPLIQMYFLPLYFLGALSVGYFSGYFLLIFGTKVAKGRRRIHPAMNLLNTCVVAAVWVLFIAGPVLLAAKNLPVILRNQHSALRDYFARVESSLPPPGAVILSDDANRAFYLQEILARQGKNSQYLVVDTASLKMESTLPGFVQLNPDYYHYLDRKYPQFNLSATVTNQPIDIPDPSGLIRMLASLAGQRDIYYLQPSFGFYFEAFYARPHGLLYRLHRLARNTFVIPPPGADEIAETEKFWSGVAAAEFPRLIHELQPPPKDSLLPQLLAGIHAPVEPDVDAQTAGLYYSRALISWGVELQRAASLPAASNRFEQALELKTENAAAKIDLEANEILQAGRKFVPKSDEAIAAAFGKFRTWDQVLSEDGPFDEPSFCYHLGQAFTQTFLFRQAIQQFERTRELVPDHLDAHLALAQLYGYYVRNYSNSILRADEALALAPNNVNAKFLKAGALIELRAPERAIPLLSEVIQVQTTNWAAYFNRAISYLQTGNLPAAAKDYELITNAEPTAYSAYYGLGEIAYRQKDGPAAIANYKLYLTNAPAGADPAEMKMVADRLKELSQPKP